PATPADSSRPSDILTRRCTRSPAPTTTTPGPTSATRCAAPSASARTGFIGTGFRYDCHRPPGRYPGHRGRDADLGAVRGTAARRHGGGGHQDRTAGSTRSVADVGAGRAGRPSLLLDGARTQQEGRDAEPARGGRPRA